MPEEREHVVPDRQAVEVVLLAAYASGLRDAGQAAQAGVTGAASKLRETMSRPPPDLAVVIATVRGGIASAIGDDIRVIEDRRAELEADRRLAGATNRPS